MKRSDPHHPQHRHRDGGDSGGAAAEALVSPDGTVTEAPRTVKKKAQDEGVCSHNRGVPETGVSPRDCGKQRVPVRSVKLKEVEYGAWKSRLGKERVANAVGILVWTEVL
ncbi:hypothetical protein Q9233_013265 [Columba guinea]|nr:hypothetical protein Q9233_013265 [Columba guinea]